MDSAYGFPTIHSHCPDSGPLTTQQPSVTPSWPRARSQSCGSQWAGTQRILSKFNHFMCQTERIWNLLDFDGFTVTWYFMFQSFQHRHLGQAKMVPKLVGEPIPTNFGKLTTIISKICQMFLGAASSLKSKKRRLSIFTHDPGIPRHIHLFGVNCSQK